MGACQVYAWAAAYPDMVQAIAPIAGSARTADFNKVFLAATPRSGDPAWNDGFYGDRPPVNGVRAMANIYAGWAFSEPFYRDRGSGASGRATCRSSSTLWAPFFLKVRRERPAGADDHVVAQRHRRLTRLRRRLRRRAAGDHGAGDHPARPSRTATSRRSTAEYEARGMPNAECRPIPDVWGHMAPFKPDDQVVIDAALRELLGA